MILIILSISATLSYKAFTVKKENLEFHSRDYAFFSFQYKYLFDNEAEVITNPNGRNFIGINAIDGYPTKHHSIHFSPIKYIISALFNRSTETTNNVFYFFLLINSVSLLYASLLLSKNNKHIAIFFLISAVLIPSHIKHITFDLRPFILLSSCLLSLVASIYYKKSITILLAICIVGSLIREEFAIFSMIASAVLLFEGRKKDGVIMLAYSFTHFLAISYYYAYIYSYGALSGIAYYAIICLYIGLLLSIKYDFEIIKHTVADKYKLSVISIPFYYIWISETLFSQINLDKGILSNIVRLTKGFLSLLHEPNYYPAILILLFLYSATRSSGYKLSKHNFFFLILCLLASSFLAYKEIYKNIHPDFAIAHQISSNLHKHDIVLTDHKIHAAVNEHKNTFVYNRLPARININQNDRFYPKNIGNLYYMLNNSIDIVLITNKSFLEITQFIDLRNNFNSCAKNNSLIMLVRHSINCATYLTQRS